MQNMLPFLFPNPGWMYNPLGLGSLPFGAGMSNPAFGNLGQGSLMNGLSGSSNKKGSQGGKSNSSSGLPPSLANIPGLNIPSVSKKDFAESLAAAQAQLQRPKAQSVSPAAAQQPPPSLLGLPLSSQFASQEDSDDESLKSLMGNHADDLPDDDSPGENAERVVLKESSELEKEMAQQKMETRREKRERMRERDMLGGDNSHKGLTAAERQLLMVKKKERLAKEEPMLPFREGGRTTRSSARSSRLEEAVTKMREREYDDSK